MPYLRVANVGDNVLKLDDVKSMNFMPDEQKRFDLREGDILISEGQSRELVGQSVRITSLPGPMCFQNTLIRFRAYPDSVRSEYAQAVFRACLYAGIFADIATQTTSIAHLGARRFADLKVPMPALSDQDRTLAELRAIADSIAAIEHERVELTLLAGQLSAAVFEGAQ